MDEFGLRLSLLLEITGKKKNLLEIILNITFNQNCIVLGELTTETRQLFMELAKEKQKLIDEVYSLDTVFQRTYDAVKHLFNDIDKDSFKETLVSLQDTIDEVISLDGKICEIESNNNTLLEQKKLDVQKINVPKADKNRILEQYNKQSSNYLKNKLLK